MIKNELDKILENHKLWLNDEGGECADLKGADLRYAHLRYANLRGTNLKGADLKYADLRNTDLNHTKLYDADLSGANLRYANLYGANLKNTNLRNIDLNSADLRGADLNGANLYDANLTDIKTNIHTIGYNLACPEEGSFIGYKKAKDCIVKLLIMEDSKRSSATTLKCRCDKAKVLDIEKIDTGEKVESISSNYNDDFIYKVGEIVKVDDFDEDRWNECSPGIHFFINKQNAIKY